MGVRVLSIGHRFSSNPFLKSNMYMCLSRQLWNVTHTVGNHASLSFYLLIIARVVMFVIPVSPGLPPEKRSHDI